MLVSSAEATATDVFAALRNRDLVADQQPLGTHRFISSSAEGSFSELGIRFLGPEFGQVEHHPWPHEARI